MTIYKQILDNQKGLCSGCGEEIKKYGFPRFLLKDDVPVSAMCNKCSSIKDADSALRNDNYFSEILRLIRQKERENWLDPSNEQYEIRLRCHQEGHKALSSWQGFSGGGCWCGYYSPEERPNKTGY